MLRSFFTRTIKFLIVILFGIIRTANILHTIFYTNSISICKSEKKNDSGEYIFHHPFLLHASINKNVGQILDLTLFSVIEEVFEDKKGTNVRFTLDDIEKELEIIVNKLIFETILYQKSLYPDIKNNALKHIDVWASNIKETSKKMFYNDSSFDNDRDAADDLGNENNFMDDLKTCGNQENNLDAKTRIIDFSKMVLKQIPDELKIYLRNSNFFDYNEIKKSIEKEYIGTYRKNENPGNYNNLLDVFRSYYEETKKDMKAYEISISLIEFTLENKHIFFLNSNPSIFNIIDDEISKAKKNESGYYILRLRILPDSSPQFNFSKISYDITNNTTPDVFVNADINSIDHKNFESGRIYEDLILFLNEILDLADIKKNDPAGNVISIKNDATGKKRITFLNCEYCDNLPTLKYRYLRRKI